MESEEIRELRATLLRLKQEHRDLDSAINALEESGRADALQLKRLKKKKLYLKDEIARLVGRDRSTIANLLRLLKLPDAVKSLMQDKKLHLCHFQKSRFRSLDVALQEQPYAVIVPALPLRLECGDRPEARRGEIEAHQRAEDLGLVVAFDRDVVHAHLTPAQC